MDLKYQKYLNELFKNAETLVKDYKKVFSEKKKTTLKDKLMIFNENDNNLRIKIATKLEFSAFEYLRNICELSDPEWFYLLISVMKNISHKYTVLDNPIDDTLDIFLINSDNIRFYFIKSLLESKMSSLLFNKDELDPYILDFLMSNAKFTNYPREFNVLFPSKKEIERESDAEKICDLCSTSEKTLYFFITSQKGEGKKTFIKHIASKCGLPIVIVDIEKCLNSEKDFSFTVTSALRQAMILNSFVCYANFHLLENKRREAEFILKSSKNFCRRVFFSLNSNIETVGSGYDDVLHINFKMSELTTKQIARIWKDEVPFFKVDEIYYEIANLFNFNPGQIKIASKRIKSVKYLNKKVGKKEIFEEIYETVKANFKGNAKLLKSNNIWKNLIIAKKDKQTLISICNQQKFKNVVFEDWKMGKYMKGISLLFSGPPGTGKTMAAKIIAKDLGLEIYRVDLSRIISKYIGETEKNLALVFDESERSNSVLLFDETDALFSQRSNVKDARDRSSNLEISYLLQKMEEHNGVCIMTTNYIENIDKAFFRRITYVIHFCTPNKNERKEIWQSIFSKYVPLSKDIDFDFVSKFEISGGSIKNIALSACFMAAEEKNKVSMKHILISLENELKKQGHTALKSDFGSYSYLLNL
ncbi:MAG: AAA family ATPase [Firmicutes bacterium]|nr:AAA family ATPase [Bacillota bacterium]